MAYRPDMVPLQYVDLPIARGDEQKIHWLAQVATTPLPGVVLDNTGAFVSEMLEGVRPLLPPGMTVPPNPQRIPFQRRGDDVLVTGDFGLHIDRDPVAPTQKTIEINFNHVRFGVAAWAILRFAPDALRHPRSRELLNSYCNDAQTAMRGGMVDPHLFLPVCYRATVSPGQTLVFREGEPLAHDVITQTHDRNSEAVIGSLAITPGLELTRHMGRSRRPRED